MPIQLIVGLGNPGPKYIHARHNAGVWLITQLLEHANPSVLHDEKKFHGETARVELFHHSVHLLTPNTYMNESGRSVLAIAHFYKILPADILIVHDDLDLAPGDIRLKQGGGDGGHQGLNDIISRLHSPDFWRLRIGIGHPGHKDQVTDYVLERPSRDDTIEIARAIDRAIAVMPDILADNFNQAMQTLHTKQ